jgi:hypothetical protein
MKHKEDGLGSAATDNQALTPDTEQSAKEASNIVTSILTNSTSIDLELFGVGEHRISCPQCGRSSKDRTLGITVKAIGDAVAHCFRCNLIKSLKSRRRTHYKPVLKAQVPLQAKRTTLSVQGRSLWAECEQVSGIAVNYLRSRNCMIPPEDSDLRWHPNLRHSSGYVGAALVGLVTNIETNEPMSLHRTWITSTGKADIDPNRMLLGGHTSRHGVIRLYPDEFVTTGLGIAEGIETALSLAHEYHPVWAAISAGNMGSLPVLIGIESLTIAVDNDDAGRSATESLSRRWHDARIKVRHVRVAHGDLNDHLEVLHG